MCRNRHPIREFVSLNWEHQEHGRQQRLVRDVSARTQTNISSLPGSGPRQA